MTRRRANETKDICIGHPDGRGDCRHDRRLLFIRGNHHDILRLGLSRLRLLLPLVLEALLLPSALLAPAWLPSPGLPATATGAPDRAAAFNTARHQAGHCNFGNTAISAQHTARDTAFYEARHPACTAPRYQACGRSTAPHGEAYAQGRQAVLKAVAGNPHPAFHKHTCAAAHARAHDRPLRVFVRGFRPDLECS